jgi:hypothetical protein
MSVLQCRVGIDFFGLIELAVPQSVTGTDYHLFTDYEGTEIPSTGPLILDTESGWILGHGWSSHHPVHR